MLSALVTTGLLLGTPLASCNSHHPVVVPLIRQAFDDTTAAPVVVRGGMWAVEDGRYRLTEPASGRPDNANLAVHDPGFVYEDFRMQADARVDLKGAARPGGLSLVFDFVDATAYSYVALGTRPGRDDSGLFRVSGDVVKRLASIRTPILAGRWHRIVVRRQEGWIRVQVDGHTVAAVPESAGSTAVRRSSATSFAAAEAARRFGVGTRDSAASFDNLIVVAFEDDPPPTPTPTETPLPTEEPTASPTPSPTPPLSGRIAFVSDRSGNFDIYSTLVEGGPLVNLTAHPADDDDFEWSPDGQRIAFRSRRDGNAELYLMDADGANVVRLTTTPEAAESTPRWSPDGSRLAWVESAGGASRLLSAGLDGSVPLVLAATTPPSRNDEPQWSPDGTALVFRSDRTGGGDIYVVAAAGGEPTLVAGGGAAERRPAWALSGGEVWYESEATGNPDIFKVSLADFVVTNVTNDRRDDRRPRPSPDGSLLLYESGNGARPWSLWALPLTGEPAYPLATSTAAVDMDLDWSPGGEAVAYTAAQGADREVFVVRRDGTGTLNISDTAPHVADLHPRWQPVLRDR